MNPIPPSTRFQHLLTLIVERESKEKIYNTAQTTIPIAPVVVVNMPNKFFSMAKEAPEVAGVMSAPFPFPFPFPFPLLCVALLLVPLRFAPGAIGYVEFFLWASTLGQQEAIVVKRRVVLRMEKRIVAVFVLWLIGELLCLCVYVCMMMTHTNAVWRSWSQEEIVVNCLLACLLDGSGEAR